ncbi:MAG: aldo/keto reductase [Planctomycetota bacterium]|nr:aldo/keto reductase [Planctomycetota bacterium]
MSNDLPTRRRFLATSAIALSSAAIASAQPATTQSQSMLTRKIPSSGESIPVVGLGTWNALNPEKLDDASLKPLEEVVRIFYDAGGRVIDTAPSYGSAEEVTGILTDRMELSDKVFIATKVLERGAEAGLGSFNRSLQRLKRQKIELMQVHNFTDWKTVLPLLREWKQKGTFRYIGVTHYQDHAHDDLEAIIKADKPDFLQLNYSIAERAAEKRLLPVARDNGTATLINRPFASGGLIRSVSAKPLPDFVKPFASTWAEALLKFVLAEEAVTCIIPATRNPKHMQENVRAGFGRLPTKDEREKLAAAIV